MLASAWRDPPRWLHRRCVSCSFRSGSHIHAKRVCSMRHLHTLLMQHRSAAAWMLVAPSTFASSSSRDTRRAVREAWSAVAPSQADGFAGGDAGQRTLRADRCARGARGAAVSRRRSSAYFGPSMGASNHCLELMVRKRLGQIPLGPKDSPTESGLRIWPLIWIINCGACRYH